MRRAIAAVCLAAILSALAVAQEPSRFDSSGRVAGAPGTNLRDCKTIAEWADAATKGRARENRNQACAALANASESAAVTAADIAEFERALPALTAATDTNIRGCGYTVIGTLKIASGEALCLDVFKKNDTAVMQEAAAALGKLRSAKAIPVLFSSFPVKDRRNVLRSDCDTAIAEALGQIGGADAKAALEKMAKRAEDHELKEAIAKSLDRIDGIGK